MLEVKIQKLWRNDFSKYNVSLSLHRYQVENDINVCIEEENIMWQLVKKEKGELVKTILL